MKRSGVTLVMATICLLALAYGSGRAELTGAKDLRISDVTPQLLGCGENPTAALDNVIDPDKVTFQWCCKGTKSWSSPVPPVNRQSADFVVPCPTHSGWWALCAREGKRSGVWRAWVVFQSSGAGANAAIERLSGEGIVATASVEEFGTADILSSVDAQALLGRTLAHVSKQPSLRHGSIGTKLVDRGIWTAEEGMTFSAAQAEVSREDFARWLARFSVRDEVGNPSSRDPLEVATDQGIVLGYPGGGTKWSQPITRGEAALMLDRLLITSVAPDDLPPPPPE